MPVLSQVTGLSWYRWITRLYILFDVLQICCTQVQFSLCNKYVSELHSKIKYKGSFGNFD